MSYLCQIGIRLLQKVQATYVCDLPAVKRNIEYADIKAVRISENSEENNNLLSQDEPAPNLVIQQIIFTYLLYQEI
jgi:hypothetical protein